jgi:hypothetical protein
LTEEGFVDRCYQARSITRDRAHISKYAEGAEALRNKMPYWFVVLKDLLGLREDEAGPRPPIRL